MIKKILAPGDESALVSFSLLVLRLWLGLTMFFVHGMDKLNNFNHYAAMFPNPIGIGVKPGLVLVLIAETAGAILLAVGLLSRLGALMLAVDMGVAFFLVHKMAFGGDHPGELAFIYLAGFVTLFLAGPGKISMDKALFGKGK
ncbi:MAG TPA: DoxX family protein [Candidatus Sulfotelmatobacter sp.]|nr:DoxX family protein [Candidatus Sulfotelmatobacter sp.]